MEVVFEKFMQLVEAGDVNGLKRYELSVDDDDLPGVCDLLYLVEAASKHGHLKMVKYLYYTYHEQANGWILYNAACFGHNHVVKWVMNNIRFTLGNIAFARHCCTKRSTKRLIQRRLNLMWQLGFRKADEYRCISRDFAGRLVSKPQIFPKREDEKQEKRCYQNYQRCLQGRYFFKLLNITTEE